MRPAISLARWLLAVWAETPARAASSPAGLASPPASAMHMAAREGSARRLATNAMSGSLIDRSLPRSGAAMFHGRSNPNLQIRGGGGVENYDAMDLTNVVISGNSADSGGGIYNAGTLTLTNVVISGNTSLDVGGGIYNDRGTVYLSNVTITGNTAGTGGGGIANSS